MDINDFTCIKRSLVRSIGSLYGKGVFSMNILLDLRWMETGQAGGMEQMARELIAGIARLEGVGTAWVYCPLAAWNSLEWRSSLRHVDSDRISLIPERCLYELGQSEAGRSKRLGLRGESPRAVMEIDCVHSIGGWVAQELRQYCGVVTIHDLQHLHFPENFDRVELGARNANYEASIESVNKTLCVSEDARGDVLARFQIEEENVETVWNIPPGATLENLDEALVWKTLRAMGIESEYLFFPSHAWPHKNHLTLVEAFAMICEQRPKLKLILSGGKFDDAHPAAKRIRDLGLEARILRIGYRTPLEIRCLYRGALALVYPSLFEGFGLPVAEAILAGTPIACSNLPPLREVGGDAVLTFEPENTEDIAGTLSRLIDDPILRDKLIEKGAKRRSVFDPQKIARRTCEIYREAAGLEPVEFKMSGRKLTLRWELAQHWGCLFEEFLKKGSHLSTIRAWLWTFWYSPSRAIRLMRNQWKRSEPIDFNRFKRHVDGWIGPRFEDWVMAPDGAKGLEFRFEAPPGQFRQGSRISVSVGDRFFFEGSFENDDSLLVSTDLPLEAPEIVKIGAECSRHFVPKEHGLSEDERRLSAKLAWIRWIR